MPNNIKKLLRLQLPLQINIRVQNPLLTRPQHLTQRLSLESKNLRKSTPRQTRILPTLHPIPPRILFLHNLTTNKHTARPLKRHRLRNSPTHRPASLVAPLLLQGLRCVPHSRPAGDVDVNVLRVFVVAEEWLGVFPAVEATYSAKGCWDDSS